ncbi:uncharacterized protein [Clytia hemisphaerica]|uniref:Uncharacterized protein n=1 Tax=Clytia hemisphaerica TaxID=252671 RepID=A0A7M5VEY9_9CNID
MRSSVILVVVACFALAQCQATPRPKRTRRKRKTPAPTEPPMGKNETVDYLMKEVKTLRGQLNQISRQLMLQQFFTEEKIRNEGFSGIKQIRTSKGGLKNYYGNTQSGSSYCSIHDHSNNIRTVGMGEFIGVLNGVEFRTRHNDFRLNQPHSTKGDYHAIEPIKFPDVPPEVLQKPDIQSQIQEMREWFKAWRDSDHTVRDYRKYFKPVLCYLEGAWTTKQGDSIDEPFESDRHSIDADSWFDLQEKVRFTSYTGSKSLGENLAFLPTTIMRFENSTPVFAQWNYRILCHPLNQSVPLTKFKPAEDIASRMKRKMSWEQYSKSRSARFELDRDLNPDEAMFREKDMARNFLDKLMEEVPGKNNYGGRIEDAGFDAEVQDFNGNGPLDVSRYHRWFKMANKDAMGRQQSHRGYADSYMFAAKTTQSRVSGLHMRACRKVKYKDGTRKLICENRNEKWSYAIPLEIIYMTPLSKWNPYGIKYNPNCAGYENTNDTRKGTGLCADYSRAKKHACDRFYYITPSEFFSASSEGEKDPADTAKKGFCMLDRDGNGVVASPSGTRIMFPEIKGVGKLRQRFPISPIHGHGTPVWKNLNALADMFMHNASYHFMKVNPKSGVEEIEFTYMLQTSRNPNVTPHEHYFSLVKSQFDKLVATGRPMVVETDIRESHSHTLKIKWNKVTKQLQYLKCSGQSLCGDEHPKLLIRSTD